MIVMNEAIEVIDETLLLEYFYLNYACISNARIFECL